MKNKRPKYNNSICDLKSYATSNPIDDCHMCGNKNTELYLTIYIFHLKGTPYSSGSNHTERIWNCEKCKDLVPEFVKIDYANPSIESKPREEIYNWDDFVNNKVCRNCKHSDNNEYTFSAFCNLHNRKMSTICGCNKFKQK